MTLDLHGNLQRIQGANGKLDPHAWLNPCHPEVHRFMTELIADVVRRYSVAGIQLDDHFCFPQELGYDKFTQQLFQQYHAGASAPIDHARSIWIDWVPHG